MEKHHLFIDSKSDFWESNVEENDETLQSLKKPHIHVKELTSDCQIQSHDLKGVSCDHEEPPRDHWGGRLDFIFT